MSAEQTKKQSTPFNFISHDGTDENGVRAEVSIQVNKGTIKEVRENTAKEVADVYFSVPNLKFPIHGWIRTDEPVFQLIKTAQQNNEEVQFRIETQRKANIDRSKPMDELRPSMDVARENLKVILVGINGHLSGEAVTNPAEDPKHAGGRYVATDKDVSEPAKGNTNSGTATIDLEALLTNFKTASATPGVRASVLDAMAAQLLLNGADVETVNAALAGNDKRDNSRPEIRQNFSMEGPSWKEYNSDGRLNLGSSVIAAGVGAETLISDRVSVVAEEQGFGGYHIQNLDDTIEYYVDMLFAIADRVQVASYGEGSRVDRGASSHVRIRGIIYEIIKKDYPLPLTFNELQDKDIEVSYDENLNKSWVGSVGKKAIKRFRRAIVAATSYKGFAAPVPNSLLPKSQQQAATPATPAPEKVAVVAEVKPIEKEVKTHQAAVVELAQPEDKTVVKKEEPSKEVPKPVTPASETFDVSMLYPQQLLTAEEVEGEDLPTDETIALFKQLFADSGFDVKDKGDLVRITKLLAYTFGADYSNVKKIPEALVEDFIDFYSAGGPEVLDQAVRVAVEQV